MKLLLVEDEGELAEVIAKGLKHEGYVVDVCSDGGKAKNLLTSNKDAFDLVILDISLPHVDGLELCSYVRQLHLTVPILMLTARGAIEDKVNALNAGADDYVTKPFSFEELLARIRALLRRPTVKINDLLRVGDISLDVAKHKVFCKGEEIEMTRKEFMLLECLMRRQNQVVTRDTLYSTLWDMNDTLFSNTVDVHIKNVRNKLGNKHGSFIKTIRGVGYVFEI